MQKVFEKLVIHRKAVIAFYVVIVVLCALLSTKVQVNTDLTEYLPSDSDSTIALTTMNEQFSDGIPNAQMMVSDIDILDAAKLEKQIRDVDGVLAVTGIADQNPYHAPYEALSEDAVSQYYRDGNALYTLTIDTEKRVVVLDELAGLTDKETSFTGSFVSAKSTQRSVTREIFTAVGIVVVFAILLFLLTLDSWITPLLLVGALLSAVAINAGTNIVFGSISSVTNTAASVLQMGVSVDYFIFILHRYREFKDQGLSAQDAMVAAMTHSLSSVLSSSLTTIIGFAALISMRYRIGLDMGLVLSKGVAISLICAFTLLPCLVLASGRLLKKTHHTPLVHDATALARASARVRKPGMALFGILLVVALAAQPLAHYYYGSSHLYPEEHQVTIDKEKIDAVFGQKNTIALLVPVGFPAEESQLARELEATPEVISVTSYATTVGYRIPPEAIFSDTRSELMSGEYSRLVVTLDADEESEETFALLDRIENTAQAHYQDKVHMVGTSASTKDLKQVITADNRTVNAIAILAIFLVLCLTMRSIKLAALLTLCIKASIWVSMLYAIVASDWLFYIGNLIVSSILLGTTVDYAILVTNRYREFSKTESTDKALHDSIACSAVSVLTSALILGAAGALLGFICTDQLTAQLGWMLARGTALAAIVVLFVLPGFLKLFARRRKPGARAL